jgi:hypothetical protein
MQSITQVPLWQVPRGLFPEPQNYWQILCYLGLEYDLSITGEWRLENIGDQVVHVMFTAPAELVFNI